MSSGCRHPAYLFRPRNTTQTPIFSGWSFLVSTSFILFPPRIIRTGSELPYISGSGQRALPQTCAQGKVNPIPQSNTNLTGISGGIGRAI